MTAPAPVEADRSPIARSSLNSRVLGGLLLVFGSSWMLKEAGVIDLPWAAVFSVVLIALGLALVITARSRARTIPLLVLGAVLTAGLAIGSSDLGLRGGIGERTYTLREPTARAEYSLGIGELTLDLRKLVLEPGIRTIRADVSIGRLLVQVPTGVELLVDVDARLGSAKVLGEDVDLHGKGSRRRETPNYDEAETKLRLILHVGVGQIEVQQ